VFIATEKGQNQSFELKEVTIFAKQK